MRNRAAVEWAFLLILQLLYAGTDSAAVTSASTPPSEAAPTVVTTPEAVGEAAEADKGEAHARVWVHGTRATPGAVRSGQGSKADTIDKDTERFFRAVDRAVLEHHSRISGVPLLLTGKR